MLKLTSLLTIKFRHLLNNVSKYCFRAVWVQLKNKAPSDMQIFSLAVKITSVYFHTIFRICPSCSKHHDIGLPCFLLYVLSYSFCSRSLALSCFVSSFVRSAINYATLSFPCNSPQDCAEQDQEEA